MRAVPQENLLREIKRRRPGVKPLRLRSAINSRAVSRRREAANASSLSSDVLPTPGPPVTRTPIIRARALVRAS